MARYTSEAFNIKLPLYVRKNFKGNGRLWLIGQYFDWKHFAVDARKVRALYKSSYLTHAEPEEAQKPVDVFSVNTEEEQENNYKVIHKGGAYYNVVNETNGDIINEKAIKKEEAEELADELNKAFNGTIAD